MTANAGANLPDLGLPTTNRALLEGHPEQFYQYVNRTVKGVASRPWSGGKFGWVRNPTVWNGQSVFSKFHEGIDIKPVSRDAKGIPRDPIMSMAPGIVRHINNHSGHSSYGRYVVVEHATSDGPLFSLYAHMQSISVNPGTRVKKGDKLGVLGWSGPGLNLTRAHLHVELCILLHSDFQRWHDLCASGTNHHGIHNGLNMIGLDLAWIFEQQKRGKKVSLTDATRRFSPAWRAIIPRTDRFELAKRYPHLATRKALTAPCLEVTFSRHGLPLSLSPARHKVTQPTLSWVADTTLATTMFTNWRVTRQKSGIKLTKSGRNFLALVGGTFPAAR